MGQFSPQPMVKHWILFVVVSILSIQCRIPERQIPEGILSDSSMRTILFDVYLAEGGRSGGKKMLDERSIDDYYEMIYRKHGITKERFSQSFAFYSEYPEKMAAIHEQLVRQLMELDAKLASKADSARDIRGSQNIDFDEFPIEE